jgi:large subunit ribosomal protein L28
MLKLNTTIANQSPDHQITRCIHHRMESPLAKTCEICGKGPVVGRQHSHANNVSPRRFEPNLQTVRAVVDGGVKRIKVCTRCIRSQKVVKAA